MTELGGALAPLRWHELDRAPLEPGLYAWYMSPRVGKANAAKPETARSALVGIAEKLSFPRVELTIEGHLSLELAGGLDHKHLGTRDHFPASLETVLETAEGRGFLAAIMSQVAPLFSSPLYVGVSTSLRKRLGQHRACIQRQPDEEPTDFGPDGSSAAQRDYSFGKEVQRRRIDPNDLVVCVLPVAPDADFDVRSAVEGAETLINRVFYPILGRR